MWKATHKLGRESRDEGCDSLGHMCRKTASQLPWQLLWKQRKERQAAPKKAWAKQVENDPMDQRLPFKEALCEETSENPEA